MRGALRPADRFAACVNDRTKVYDTCTLDLCAAPAGDGGSCPAWLARLSGAVVTADGRVEATSGTRPHVDGVMVRGKLGRAQREGRLSRRANAGRAALVLLDDWATNFLHFHVELVPKLVYFHALRYRRSRHSATRHSRAHASPCAANAASATNPIVRPAGALCRPEPT